MRHGDRADDHEASPEVQALVDRVEDTPLSPAGLDTAAKVSHTHLSSQGIEIIISSPMLRCIQTASIAASILKKPNVTLDLDLREVWHPKVLKKPVYEVQLRTLEEIQRFPPHFVNIVANQATLNTLGTQNTFREETRGIGGSADRRFQDEIDRLATELYKKGYKSALFVTHGDCLGSAVARFVRGKSIFEVNYCGIVRGDFDLDLNTGNITWTLGDSNPGVGIMDD